MAMMSASAGPDASSKSAPILESIILQAGIIVNLSQYVTKG